MGPSELRSRTAPIGGPMCCLLTHTVHNNASRILKEAPSDLGRSKTSYTLSPLNDFNWPLRSVPPKYLKITDASYPKEGNQLQGLYFFTCSAFKSLSTAVPNKPITWFATFVTRCSAAYNLSRENIAHAQQNSTTTGSADLYFELEVHLLFLKAYTSERAHNHQCTIT